MKIFLLFLLVSLANTLISVEPAFGKEFKQIRELESEVYITGDRNLKVYIMRQNPAPVILVVRDIHNALVYETVMSSREQKNGYKLDVKSMKEGYYTLHVINGKDVSKKQFWVSYAHEVVRFINLPQPEM
jgi:hypothetical protein